jgi:predicted Zn-dependent protease
MNKRLAMLEQLVSSGKADSFARYGLAMEYRKEKRQEEALTAFRALREADPSYLPAYLMTGQLLLEMSKNEDAKECLIAGIALAKEKGDGKTLGELEDALAEC